MKITLLYALFFHFLIQLNFGYICTMDYCSDDFLDSNFFGYSKEDDARNLYQCDIPDCNQLYLDLKSLYHHQITKHFTRILGKINGYSTMYKNETYTIDYSLDEFLDPNFFDYSERDLDGDSAPNLYQCNILGCNQIYKDLESLDLHKLKHLTYLRCNNCNKIYGNKKALDNHIQAKHSNVRFKCDYPGCSKEYAGYSGLTYHKRKHLGDLRYQCPVCSKKFLQKTSLTGHLRTHSGEKPFVCPKCNRAFSLKNNCDRHETSCRSVIRSKK